ncbi:MAG TPA: hypothetical protein VN650_02150 [Gemmatimonadaceae bacterium]|nr:hypothetical protein [Gemmatimonadaceae bacterium]
MAQQLFEGTFSQGRVINPEIGQNSVGKPSVRWSMVVVDDGEHKGKTANYSGKLDPDNIKWTKRDMIAIGWQGKDVRTFVDDVKKANRLVPFTAEIATYKRPDGSVSEWTSARMGGAAPLNALDADAAAKVNGWFAEAQDMAPAAKDDGLPF